MMKFHAGLTSVMATVLVVPAVLPSDDPLDTLGSALSDTVRALEVLAGIQARGGPDDPIPTGLVLSVTENPILEARSRDERLVALRNEVNLLQTELDTLEAPTANLPTPIGPVASGTVSKGSDPLQAITTGFDEGLRQALQGLHDADASKDPIESTSGQIGSGANASGGTRAGAPMEHKGYSADPVSQAQACYRAGLYEKGIALLNDPKKNTKALYWRARCLEKLDRFDEAMADLQRVSELSAESYEGRRAKTDLEFIEWKKGFLKRLPGGAKPKK